MEEGCCLGNTLFLSFYSQLMMKKINPLIFFLGCATFCIGQSDTLIFNNKLAEYGSVEMLSIGNKENLCYQFFRDIQTQTPVTGTIKIVCRQDELWYFTCENGIPRSDTYYGANYTVYSIYQENLTHRTQVKKGEAVKLDITKAFEGGRTVFYDLKMHKSSCIVRVYEFKKHGKKRILYAKYKGEISLSDLSESILLIS